MKPRKSSIEVINEKEDLTSFVESVKIANKSEAPKESSSENNDFNDDSEVKISIISHNESDHNVFEYISDIHHVEDTDSKWYEDLEAILQDNEHTFLENENFINLKKGFIWLENGINNVWIPVDKDDIGSIIAFSLNTNWYYEGLARQNYMEFQSKIDQHSCETYEDEKDTESKVNVDKNGPKDYIENKGSGLQIPGLQNQISAVKSNLDSNKNKKERIRLNDKTDVLDSEYLLHHIESEFLSYEKINFKLKWSTNKKDMKMKVFKNIFRVDHIHGNVREYCHKNKNIDEFVLPKYSISFLDDESVIKTWWEMSELKKILELRNSNLNQRKGHESNMSLDSNSQGYQSTQGLNLNKINSMDTVKQVQLLSKLSEVGYIPTSISPSIEPEKKFTGEEAPKINLNNISGIPDLVITPLQPPVHLLTDRYKTKKVMLLVSIQQIIPIL
jgi:hypothetical protein